MNNIELMLKILGVSFNEIFKVIALNKQVIGTYVIELLNNNDFVLKHYNSKTGHWRIKSNDILGSLLMSIIKGTHIIESMHCTQIKKFKTVKFKKHILCKEYPVYIEDVSISTSNDNYVIVQYINHDECEKTKILKCYKTTIGDSYCHFGWGGHRLHVGYKGPLILVNVPEEDKSMLNKVISHYGTIIM